MAMLDESPVLSGVTDASVVLEGVSWKTYERLLQGIGDDHVSVTYDNGLMEIEMSPSRKHELDADFLRSLVTLVSVLKDIPVEAGGETTHKREDLAKGLEPDGCYWIANEKTMRGVADLDLSEHPAPDLVIVVDVTSRSVNKIAIYAELGVPEIWHVDRDELVFLVLDKSGGTYTTVETSLSFPFVSRSLVSAALKSSGTHGQSSALKRLVSDLKLK
ncbi:MAG: Uma2 family endonuclease [Planctomycetota bacterium]